MTVRLIHVGLGGWGGNWARNVVPNEELITVAALVEPDQKTRRTVLAELGLPDALGFASLAAALDAVESDAVLLTTPAVTHAPLAREALAAGKHVLVEKPFAATAEEAAALVATADDAGLLIHVSQNYRYYPAPRAARDLLARGAVGEVVSIDIDFRQWDNDLAVGAHPHYAFPHPLLHDMAIHHFDLLRMVTGEEARAVFAKSSAPSFSKYDDEAAAAVIIELDSGITVSYRGSWVSRGKPTGWAGEWRIDGADGEIFFTSRLGPIEDGAGDVVEVRDVASAERRALPLAATGLVDRAGSLHAFAHDILTGESTGHHGRDNVGSIALMEAATRSAESGLFEAVIVPTPLDDRKEQAHA
ncbi:Gfo/Idh/MocA family protein [Microbacterium sp. GCS4]|uniref:Gfo/Idh/MocA family protein n=1 Tax=Microbacterium sp. GCS4 TaxID=1692239 RepID=UPI001F2BB26A|nr:Gfo/Idh/MocA family oxidoreductase [Microbacterium sp. GCS4]